jgi:hypothetical protein
VRVSDRPNDSAISLVAADHGPNRQLERLLAGAGRMPNHFLVGRSDRLPGCRLYDWTDRHPAIVSAVAKVRAKSFTLDGEAVVSGVDSIAVFDALHRRRRAAECRPTIR